MREGDRERLRLGEASGGAWARRARCMREASGGAWGRRAAGDREGRRAAAHEMQ